ncbi:MAG: DUF4089 domain-containing protein [Pseudomonadota bacterium]
MDWDAYVDAATALHNLPLEGARRAEVIEQLKRIEAIAQPMLDFALDVEVEPAPVFCA